MVCMLGAKLLEKMTFIFPPETKFQDLQALIQNYAVQAKVNGIVVARSSLAMLRMSMLDSPNLGASVVFEINRPVKPGDVVIGELETNTGEPLVKPITTEGGITIHACVSVLCEL